MRDINDPIYINDVAKIMESTGLMRVKIANKNAEIVLDRSSSNMYNFHNMNEGQFGYSPHLGGEAFTGGAVFAATRSASSDDQVVNNFADYGNVPVSATQAAAPVINTPVAAPAPAPISPTGGTEIKSPIVGVFYNAPSPDAAPFATIGSTVKKGDVLCIIEAMKLMNEIIAEKDGKILDICVQNGDVVEYGTVLFKIGE